MIILMAGCFRWVKRRNRPTRDIKLVIIGLDDAGKTTTIASLQGEPPDGITPTVGFSNANITMGKWNITIYDLGGGNGVRSVWQKYYAEIYGMIFAVDAGNHNRLVESKNVLKKEIFGDPKIKGKPLVVFANKQDKDGALKEEEISKKLALQELSTEHEFKFNVFSCSAIQGYGKTMDKRIKTGLQWLLSAIDQDYTTINEKVIKESAIQREQEQKERRERMERIKKLREEREKAAKEAGVEEEQSDEDVVINPFRNIQDQVEVTEKREKKAKEKMKKIKDHQIKMNNSETTRSPVKSKKRLKEVKDVDSEGKDENDGYDNDEIEYADENNSKNKHEKKSVKKRKSIDETQLSGTEEISPKKKKKKKKKKTKKVSVDEGFEDTDIYIKKKKNKSLKNIIRMEDENADEIEDIANDLTFEYNKLNLNNKIIHNVKESDDLPRHNIIQVSSKENIRDNSPPKMKRKKKKRNNNDLDGETDNDDNWEEEHFNDARGKIKRKKKSMLDHDVNNYCVNESSSDIKTEKEINDSRVELFLARSSESLDRREHIESNCCNNNFKRGKKKKSKQNSCFHDVQDTKTEVKKKKKNKSNKTEPQVVDCTSYLENNGTTGGSLPPLRGGTKLEPIKLRGKLPTWNSAEDSAVPSWALAKPNFDDDDVIT